MKRKDDEATIAQHFEDSKSYIAPDGREVLYGLDWTMRKLQVMERGQGKCEQCKINIMCHAHHKVKRSILRDDRMENLEGLCISCHMKKHPEKQLRFGKRSVEHSSKR